MNDKNIKKDCPVSYCLSIIGGKYKPLIIFLILHNVNRFGLLQKNIPTISKQMLTSHLRDLENDGVIQRVIYPEIPPRVEYFLTSKGNSLLGIIEEMKKWGERFQR